MNGVGQPGSLADRFVARFIDGLIVGVVGVILNFVLALVSDSWLLTGFISAVATAALYLGYFAYLESSRGQAIGKRVMKLKVFGPDRVSNPTLEQAARRNIYMAFGVPACSDHRRRAGRDGRAGRGDLDRGQHQQRPAASTLVRQVRRWHPGHQGRLTGAALTSVTCSARRSVFKCLPLEHGPATPA